LDAFSAYGSLTDYAVIVALATSRIAIAFLMLPIFTNELIPAMIRNAMFVALAIIVIVVQPPIPIETLGAIGWVSLFAKELFIGLCIGIFFGLFLWAFEAAGQIVDTQVGTGMAQVMDPLTGHQTTLIGVFLERLTNYIFMAAGGFMLLVASVMESYALWPLDHVLPDIEYASKALFESEFSQFLQLMLLVAAPMLVVTFLIDVTMGLINRYAQQFNVFFLSMSLKLLSVIAMLLISLFFIVDLVVEQIMTHAGELMGKLQPLLGG
jgi:type III secretion protein T